MKGVSKIWLMGIASLPLVFAGSAALGADEALKVVAGWRIYENDADCSAITVFTDDELVGIFYDASDRTTQVLFTDQDSTSLAEGDKRTLDIILKRSDGTIDDGWEATEFSVKIFEDGRRVFVSQWLEDPALADFKRAVAVGFFYNDRKIGAYNLGGTGAALREVERCSQRVHNINPRDPFAGN